MRQSDPVLNGLHCDLYEDEKGRFFYHHRVTVVFLSIILMIHLNMTLPYKNLNQGLSPVFGDSALGLLLCRYACHT